MKNPASVLWQLAKASRSSTTHDLRFRLRNGLTITVPNAPGARFPVYEIFGDDAYDIAWMTRGIEAEASMLDFGGQVGAFSLAMAHQMPQLKVNAYEASPTTASYLQRNVDACAMSDRITVHAEAVSGATGSFEFIDNGNASAHNGLTAPDGSGTLVRVPATTFDTAVARSGGRADVVKMDIEGAEYETILRSDPGSWSTVQRVVMEYHPHETYTLADLVDFLAGVGLVLQRQDPITDKLGSAWFARA